jgi:ribosomal protein S12 methylthiotransferase
MGRHTNKKEILDLIAKIKEEIPNATLRTSLIVGFPGETEEQFNELLEFVKKVKFDRLGVFTYSKEEGTPAYKLDNQVLQKIKKERKNIIMAEQQKISLEKNREKIGSLVEVLVEGKLPNGTFFGRTYEDSPEVDGFAFIETEKELLIGEYYMCKVIGAKEYDIIVEVI